MVTGTAAPQINVERSKERKLKMKYENVYFKDGEKSARVFGRFSTKSEAIKTAESRAFNLPFLSDCSRMAVLNRETGQYVYTMTA